MDLKCSDRTGRPVRGRAKLFGRKWFEAIR